jgi:NitT/TauT family transport system substrate-binding protein
MSLVTLDRRSFIAGSLGALALPYVGGCSRGNPSRVRFAYVPVLAAAPVMIANDRGYFNDAGFEVELITISTAQDAIALLAREHLDAAVGGLSAAFFNAVHRGFAVRDAGGISYIPERGRPTALMIRADLYESGLRTPQQLRGQRIGLIGGIGTASSYYLAKMIAPMTLDDVEMIPLNGGDQGVALSRKSIAAALAWNPFTYIFEQRGIAKIAALPPVDTGTSAMFYGGRLLADRKLGVAVFSAVDRATKDIAGDGYYDPENLAIMSKHTTEPVDALKKEDRYTYKPGMPIDRPTLDAMQRVFISEKTLSYSTPISDERLIVS